MAAKVPTIPLLTPYKLGKFNLSHMCAPFKLFFFFFFFFCFPFLLWSDILTYDYMSWVLFVFWLQSCYGYYFVHSGFARNRCFWKSPAGNDSICSSVWALLIGVCLCGLLLHEDQCVSSLISMFHSVRRKVFVKSLFLFNLFLFTSKSELN
jgi:hypothetical protein